jgi:hypothetical protein
MSMSEPFDMIQEPHCSRILGHFTFGVGEMIQNSFDVVDATELLV